MTARHRPRALSALLAGIVDYAGLFPPAALPMAEAVANYAGYRGSRDAWMLGRFVVPVARLAEFEQAGRGHFPPQGHQRPWQVTALLGADPGTDLVHVRDFNLRWVGRATIDTVEGKAGSAEEVAALAAVIPPAFTYFVELPLDPDPAPLIQLVGRSGGRVKLRTGGLVPEAIPPASLVVHFLAACVAAGVPFKATAGLHHPLRGEFPLTYAADAPRAVMYGYLNLFAAAGMLLARHGAEVAERVLRETDPGAFAFEDDGIRWRGLRCPAPELAELRGLAVSFGSCSFREPVDELATIA